MLEGETHGRRDTVFSYSGNSLKAVVKEQYKLKVPKAGENPIIAKFYDLQRDTREEFPVATEVIRASSRSSSLQVSGCPGARP